MAFEKIFRENLRLIEKALPGFIKAINGVPARLEKAMLYSAKAGGKRLRPALLMECYALFGGDRRKVLPAACAVEMVHTYSLIHDDLPALDDDDLRRGKPANHRVFGEGAAVLAGDGLLTNAFSVLGLNADIEGIKPENVLTAMIILSKYAGSGGMVGGQAADLEAENYNLSSKNGKKRGAALLNYIHEHKTADLLRASAEMGTVLADAPKGDVLTLSNYAGCLGRAFQITDDVLDVAGDKKKMGKKGSDIKNMKLTYPRIYGVDESMKRAEKEIGKAQKFLDRVKNNARPKNNLQGLAGFIIQRDR